MIFYVQEINIQFEVLLCNLVEKTMQFVWKTNMEIGTNLLLVKPMTFGMHDVALVQRLSPPLKAVLNDFS